MGGGLGGAKVKLGGKKKVGTSPFAVDDGPKMGPLVPIDYSDAEKAAVAGL